MSDKVFVDTNVFVYTRDSANTDKQKAAEDWIRTLWRRACGATSIQVLNEYYVTVTSKLAPGLSTDEAWADVFDLLSWEPRPIDRTLIELAQHIYRRWQLSWWDCLIVAAAQLEACDYLISEDLGDEVTFGETTVLNPFTHTTRDVLNGL